MNTKKIISFNIITIFICVFLLGCNQNKNNKNNSFSEHSSLSAKEKNITEISEYTTTTENIISTQPPKAPLLTDISNARSFKSGVAWVESENKWNIVDTNGNIKKSFSNDYTIITDFEGGFSVIDPDAKISMNGKITISNQAIIVDTNGSILLDLKTNGYSILNYDGLPDGSILLEKNIDTFEKSGDYIYHYDLINGIAKEICPMEENRIFNRFRYVGNGYYILTREIESPNEVLCFHNYFDEKTLSFQNNPTIIEALGEAPVYKEWSVFNVDDKVICKVNDRIFLINLNDNSCSLAALDYSVYSKTNKVSLYYDYNIYGKIFLETIGSITKVNWDEHYLDFVQNKCYYFQPNCEYECEIIDYKNDFFLVTTQNKNDTIFYTIIDENMNPLFSPKRYNKTTSIINNCLLSEEDGLITITNLTNMSIVKEIDNSTIVYTDYQNNYVWVNKNQNSTECYNIQNGELIFQIEEVFDVLSNFNNEFCLIKNSKTNQFMYIKNNGNKLEIKKNINEE